MKKRIRITKIRTASSFTMIEMLITMSIFSLLLTVLVASVFSSTKVWKKADSLLIRSTELEAGLDEITWELEHLYFEPDREDPVFMMSEGGIGLEYWAIEPWIGQAVSGGAICQVSWKIENLQGKSDLYKTTQFFVADHPIGEPIKRPVVRDVQQFQVECFENGKWSGIWEKKTPPQAIRIRATVSGAPPLTRWRTAQPHCGEVTSS